MSFDVIVAPEALSRFRDVPDEVQDTFAAHLIDIGEAPEKHLRIAPTPPFPPRIGYIHDFTVNISTSSDRYFVTLFAAYGPEDNQIGIMDATVRKYPTAPPLAYAS